MLATDSLARVGATWRPDAGLAIGVFGLALAVRLVLVGGGPVYFAGDSTTYLVAADGLAQGGGLDIPLHRAAGYPLFLAAVHLVAGEGVAAVAIAQHMLGALTATLGYLIAAGAFGRLAGVLAGLLIGASGPLVVFERYLMAEALFGFLVTLAFWLLLNGQRRQRMPLILAAGLMLALACGVRSVGLTLAPAAVLAILLGPMDRAVRWRQLEVFTLGLLLLVAPLLIWNRLREADAGSVIGSHLYGRVVRHDTLALPPLEPPPSGLTPRTAAARELVLELAARGELPSRVRLMLAARLGASEAEANVAMRRAALEIIALQPGRYLVGTLGQAVALLRGTPELLPGDGPLPLLQPADLAPILAAGVLSGLWRSAIGSGSRPLLALGVAAISLVIVSAALVGNVPRYRYPIDPLLAVLVAGGLAWALERASYFAEAVGRGRSFPV